MQLFYPLRSISETSNRITNYDSVNSLTNRNNHYTLLYPDLVQELFNFSLHNSNSVKNNASFLRNIGVNNTKSSSLNSSLSSSLGSEDSSLSPRDILFFLKIVSLYQLELSKGNSAITYSSLKLAKLLGVDASCEDVNVLGAANMRANILKLTSKLEALGLLKVFRSKRSNGMDLANKLVPVLPDKLYARFKGSPTNLKVSDSSKLDHESNLDHILRTKLFVPIELEFMKSLFKNNLPSKYKLFFLNCIMSAYRNFRLNSNICFTQDSNSRAGEDINSVFCDSRGNFIDLTNKLSFSATSSELVKKNNISKRTLFNIFKYIKQQGDSFFLQVEHKYTKSDDIDSNRYDKSIFVISINPLVFPISQIKSQIEEITEFDHDIFQCSNSSIFPDTYEGIGEGVQKKQPSSAKKTALNNKEEIIKNEYSKNIDYTDEKSEEEFLGNELCSFPSESYNNSFKNSIKTKPSCSNTTSESAARTIKDISVKERELVEYVKQIPKVSNTSTIKNEAQELELRHFYPLSEKDIDTLNVRANREFSSNFINQLLLKLYIKYPEKRFKNKFTFLRYMEKILKNEKHQGPLVNHTSFRFSCNIGAIEKNLLEYEKYLNQIESSFDTSKEMQVRKKIAGRFSTNVAYEILTQIEFETNHDNSFITVLVPNQLAVILSERQIAILSEQLEAVYGINGYYVQEVAKETLPQQTTTSGIAPDDKSIGNLASSNTSSAILENTVWHQIRKGMREELGNDIDQAWFSKTVVKECAETKTLTLTMPTRFMADWVKNNYSHVIRRLAGSTGVKRVEYEC